MFPFRIAWFLRMRVMLGATLPVPIYKPSALIPRGWLVLLFSPSLGFCFDGLRSLLCCSITSTCSCCRCSSRHRWVCLSHVLLSLRNASVWKRPWKCVSASTFRNKLCGFPIGLCNDRFSCGPARCVLATLGNEWVVYFPLFFFGGNIVFWIVQKKPQLGLRLPRTTRRGEVTQRDGFGMHFKWLRIPISVEDSQRRSLSADSSSFLFHPLLFLSVTSFLYYVTRQVLI